MPARGLYIEIEPLAKLPAITRRAVAEATARANARPQTLVKGVSRNAPRAVDAAGVPNHEGATRRG